MTLNFQHQEISSLVMRGPHVFQMTQGSKSYFCSKKSCWSKLISIYFSVDLNWLTSSYHNLKKDIAEWDFLRYFQTLCNTDARCSFPSWNSNFADQKKSWVQFHGWSEFLGWPTLMALRDNAYPLWIQSALTKWGPCSRWR